VATASIATSLRLPNGSRLIARPAIARTTRGYSRARLIIIDEAAFVPDSIFRSLTPSLATSQGSLWLLSTPHGQANEFARFWQDAESGFTRFQITRRPNAPASRPSSSPPSAKCTASYPTPRSISAEFISQGVQLLTREQVRAAFLPAAPVPALAMQGQTRYYFGLDLGKRQDHSALVTVELTWSLGPQDPATRTRRATAPPDHPLRGPPAPGL
jgi:phage FluMu gp28-like protein